ncbi:MAG: hypothetical protein ABDH63_07185 [Candidatus Caldarchaeales archaeon]
MMGRISPAIFGAIPLILAIVQLTANVGTPDAMFHQMSLKAGEVHVIDLRLNPGDRYVIEAQTDSLINVYIMESRFYRQYKETGKPPASALVFAMVRSLTVALPSNEGGEYKLVIEQIRDGNVKVTVRPGLIEEAVSRMRKGENVVRNAMEAELPTGTTHVIPIYQFVKGTLLEMEVQGADTATVLSFTEYLAYSRGQKGLESLCYPGRCIKGSGSLTLSSEEFGDVYVLVQVAKGTASLRMKVIATPDMLLYAGTCG